MSRKSFKTYKRTDQPEFDIDGTVFLMNPFVPGKVILDFLSGADADDPAAIARVVNELLDAAIAPEDKEKFNAFISDPENNVDLDTLSEIAGYASEVLSAGNPQQPSVPSTPG